MTSDDRVLLRTDQLMSELTDVDAELRKLNVDKDKQIKALVDKFAPKVDPLTARRTELVKMVGELYQENSALLTEESGKTAVFRNGVLSSRLSPGSLIVNDENKALAYIKRQGKLRRFTRMGKRTLDKVALKKDLAFVEKLPGVHFDQPENLTIKLIRTSIEIQHKLLPFRTRIN